MKKTIILFFIFSFSFFIYCSAQIITTIAGNGIQGFSGDGGPVTIAEFYGPSAIVFDKSGNMYIDDSGNSRIRKVTASTGIITTYAGGGMGFGGPATAAGLELPNGIAVDDSGNIYIADTWDYAIRKVTASTGIITTVAGIPGSLNYGYYGDGGQATDALLNQPMDVALDDTGNIYIADELNNVIRKVTVSTGIITTVAGNGYDAGSGRGGYSGNNGPATDAELFAPYGVTLDDSANIYIADFNNDVIRKVIASTGIITRIAGIHAAGYSGDGGPATLAELREPVYVRLDSYGNIYVADNANNKIREITISTGIINTIAGNGAGGYTGDGGPATAAEFAGPDGITFDSLGNLYIADQGNNVIRKVTYDTNTVTGVTKLIVKSEGVRMFPNPNNGTFNLYLSNVSNKCTVEIFNYLGENIYQAKINFGNTEINLSGQAQGIYLYRVLKEDGSLVGEGKVIIEK